jgi:uncharacterized protein (TIGR02266 family)
MSAVSDEIPRPVRVVFPVQVAFSGATFKISEFTANLSVGGIFLLTDHDVAPGTRGTLTFRISQWEDPFTVDAEVVRVDPGDDARPAGLGIQFLDLGPTEIRRLRRLVDGIRDGSVSEAIRRSIREEKRDLLEDLRRRPMDQKVIFALSAERKEIDALIRDGVPAVVIRLLDNPRLTAVQVKQVLRDPRMNTRILIAVRREHKWMNDEENRFLFCIHPHAPLQDALNLLNQLSVERLKAIQANGALKQQLRGKAGLLLTQKRKSRF